MSRRAVSEEHFAIVAHFDVVSFPSTVQQSIQHHTLALVDRNVTQGLPEARLLKNSSERRLSAIDRAAM